MVAPLWFYLHPTGQDTLFLLDTYRPTCDLYKATTFVQERCHSEILQQKKQTLECLHP